MSVRGRGIEEEARWKIVVRVIAVNKFLRSKLLELGAGSKVGLIVALIAIVFYDM